MVAVISAALAGVAQATNVSAARVSPKTGVTRERRARVIEILFLTRSMVLAFW